MSDAYEQQMEHLYAELNRVRAERDAAVAELARMKARPAEAEFSRLDVMWQELVRERDAARSEAEQLQERLARINEWADTYGAALSPSAGSADTFGDGIRAAKKQIKALLSDPNRSRL